MFQDTNDSAGQSRSWMNRKMDIDAQMSDLQSDISKIRRAKDEAELEVRAKKKEIERIKVELTEIENKTKRQDQEIFELEEQYKALKKELDKVLVNIKSGKDEMSNA